MLSFETGYRFRVQITPTYKCSIAKLWALKTDRSTSIILSLGLSAGWSSSSTSSPLIHTFKAPMHKVTVMLEEEGDIPKLFPQSWKTSRNAEALRALFTRSDGLSPNPEQHHTIPPTPPNFTLDTPCSQSSAVLLANQTSLLDCQKEEHSEWSVTLRTCPHSSSPVAAHIPPLHLLLCIVLGDASPESPTLLLLDYCRYCSLLYS